MRYFLVDKITEHVPGEWVRAIKNVTLTDEVLHDHFPDHPIMPGVLIVESLAQAAGFLIEMSASGPEQRAILGQIDKAKFYSPARPGDQLDLRVRLTSRMDAAAQVHGEAFVGDRRVARADLTFMMRTLVGSDTERVHEQRRALYRIWTRELDEAKGAS